MNEFLITTAALALLRSGLHMQALASYWRDYGIDASGERFLSANGTRDEIVYTVLDWQVQGGAIQTFRGEALDLERMERSGEALVYDVNGAPIVLTFVKRRDHKRKQAVRLVPPEDAFGVNTRRTMKRLFEKADQPISRHVDHRLLSLMFWLDGAKRILEFEDEL